MTIQQLIQTARNGNPHSLSSFLLNYRAKCLKELKKKHQCPKNKGEDCFAEAVYQFIKRFVWEKAAPPENTKKAESYLYITAKNYYLYLKNKYKNEVQELDVYQIGLSLKLQQGEKEYNPLIRAESVGELSAEKSKKIEAMKIGFSKLSCLCQKLLEARKLDGDKPDEILEQFHYKDKKSLNSKISQCLKCLILLTQKAYKK